jgi:hypothetical protein
VISRRSRRLGISADRAALRLVRAAAGGRVQRVVLEHEQRGVAPPNRLVRHKHSTIDVRASCDVEHAEHPGERADEAAQSGDEQARRHRNYGVEDLIPREEAGTHDEDAVRAAVRSLASAHQAAPQQRQHEPCAEEQRSDLDHLLGRGPHELSELLLGYEEIHRPTNKACV